MLHHHILSLSVIVADINPSMTLSLGFNGITVTFTNSVSSIIVSSIASILKHVLLSPGLMISKSLLTLMSL